MSQGWIKLHRKILDWEWYDDPKTFRLFIHCLLKANHKDKKWRGNKISRGSFITSLNNLSLETGLSLQQVRTCLDKLESTNEINKASTSVNTCVTIINYDDYQSDNTPITNDQQTSNKRVTTTKNEKNVKNDNNNSVTALADDVPNTSDSETWNASIRVANKLLDSICEFDPTHKYNRNPPSLSGWVKDIDRAMRLDGRTEDQMGFIIDAIFYNNHKFQNLWEQWPMNIESGKKLRDKFDAIKNQIKTSSQNYNGNSRKPTKGDLHAEALRNM